MRSNFISIFDQDYNVNCKYDYNDDYDITVISNFGESIPKINNGYKYFPIKHNTEYLIKLYNNTDKRCNVVLFINGKKIGVWMINAYRYISLERSYESNKNSLIEAKFIPEKTMFYEDYDILENNSFSLGINACNKKEIFQNSVIKRIMLIVDKNIKIQQDYNTCDCIHVQSECPLKYQKSYEPYYFE